MQLDYMVFSKHLAGPPLDEVARRLCDIGIKGIDLTVRPGGHVEPAAAADALPAAVETLASEGVRVGMITTNITDATEPTTEPILRTAAQLGIGYYKLGYYRYETFGTIRQRRDEVAACVRDLAALNGELGIHGGFHNHSHDFIGAMLGDVHAMIDELDPQAIGVYLDPAHASIEGGSSGWRLGMDLLSDRITMLAVKDYRWLDEPRGDGRKYAGGRRHSVEYCPLAEGNTPWPEVLTHLHQVDFAGPVSLHSEYQGKHSYADLTVDEVFEQTRRDVELFRAWVAEITAGVSP